MRKLILYMIVCSLATLSLSLQAQVKFGDNPTIINPKAVLDIESTTKGLLLPRMSTLQRLAITSPPAGLQVYDNTTNSLWYFNGTAWVAAGSDNIYTVNGTLLANRTVAQGTNTLNFTSTASTGTSHFTVDGTTLNVDAVNNRLGVGTATPAVSLDARGSIHVDDASTAATANLQGGYLTWNRANVGGVGSPNGGHLGFLNHQGTGSGGFVFTTTNDNTTFNERMRITGGGNVGIGTTTPASVLTIVNDNTGDNTKDNIQVRGYATSASGNAPLLALFASQGTLASPSNLATNQALGQLHFGGRWNNADNLTGGSSLQAFYKGTGTTTLTDLNFLTSNATRMTINENGNVGIGTTAPNAPLQFANTNANRKIVLWESANNNHQFYGFGIDAGGLRYQIDNTAFNHSFFAGTGTGSSNELMRITGSGLVGIGTTNPGNRLEVNSGNSGTSGLRFTNMNSSSAVSTGAGVAPLGVNSNGDVVVVNTARVYSSVSTYDPGVGNVSGELSDNKIAIRNVGSNIATGMDLQIRSNTGGTLFNVSIAGYQQALGGGISENRTTTNTTISAAYGTFSGGNYILPNGQFAFYSGAIIPGEIGFVFITLDDGSFYRITQSVNGGSNALVLIMERLR